MTFNDRVVLRPPSPQVRPRRWWSLKDRRKARDIEKLVRYQMAKAVDEATTELSKELRKRIGL